MVRTEILSPAGSWESLSAAINAGADSVYLGIKGINMRNAGAKNFTVDELPEITGKCRESNVKVFLTVNTLVYDDEHQKIADILDGAKSAGVDAIIASDFAVITAARERGHCIHISTQMSVSNYDTVKFLSQYADRFVLARELDLKQIKAIIDRIKKENLSGPSGNLVEIETFAHGAMCVSVSGRCFMSGVTCDKSANRGECIQNCRREYRVTDITGGNEFLLGDHYVMSPKDLCTLPFIDKIQAAGIHCIKIEGRGRAADYVHVVTSAYKEALTASAEGVYTDEMREKLLAKVKTVYNREFSDGFYMGVPVNEWTGEYGSAATEKKVQIGKVVNFYAKSSVAEVLLESSALSVGEDIAFIGETTGYHRMNLQEMQVDGEFIETAPQKTYVGIRVTERIRRNDKVFKILPAE